MTLNQTIALTAMNAMIAPLLELTAAKWSFEAERQSHERSLKRLRQPSDTVFHQCELIEWRERIVNQRKSLRQLRMKLLEKTQVWTGAKYTPVDQLDNAGLLEALGAHTKEALDLLDASERIDPDILERTVYSKMRVTML